MMHDVRAAAAALTYTQVLPPPPPLASCMRARHCCYVLVNMLVLPVSTLLVHWQEELEFRRQLLLGIQAV